MAAKKTAKTGRAKKNAPARRHAASRRKSGNGRDSLALRSASPSFTVNDLAKSLGWYRDVLGFAVEEEWKDNAGKLMGVSLKAGGVSFMIGQDDWKKGRDRKKGEGFRIYCETKSSVDDLAGRIEGKGGRVDSGPTDQPWGTREIAVTDPDGFKITIARPTR